MIYLMIVIKIKYLQEIKFQPKNVPIAKNIILKIKKDLDVKTALIVTLVNKKIISIGYN
jgi:hypothetical protein